MEIFSIAYKNIKMMYKNVLFLIFLVVVPIFQISLINMIVENAAKSENAGLAQGFVEISIISKGATMLAIGEFSTGIVVQFILLAGILAGAMIVGEREDNTLMRIFAAPISKIKILSGILIGHSVIILTVSAVIIIAVKLFFGISFGNSWIDIGIVTLFAVYVSAALAFLITGVFKSPKIAGAIMSVVIIIMTFLSGGMIPGKQFDEISKFTINKWISDSYQKLMEGNSLASISTNLLIIGIIGTIFMIIAAVVYRRESIYE